MSSITDTSAYVDGTIEARDAESAAAKLDDLLADGKLSADGQAIACAGRGLIYAVLAARAALAAQIQDAGGELAEAARFAGSELADLDVTLSAGLSDLAALADVDPGPRGPACTLAWVPDWADCTTERGGGLWVIRPNRTGIRHEALPRGYGKHAGAETLAGMVSDRIGSPVAMYLRHRLSVGAWRVWPTPVWHVYPVPPGDIARAADDVDVDAGACERAEAQSA